MVAGIRRFHIHSFKIEQKQPALMDIHFLNLSFKTNIVLVYKKRIDLSIKSMLEFIIFKIANLSD